MKKTITSVIIAMFLVGTLFIMHANSSAKAQQEIKEINMLTRFMDQIFDNIKVMHRLSHDMKREAEPFKSPRHRARYRFAPNDNNPRNIMVKARNCMSIFKTVNGILSHSALDNRRIIFNDINATLDSISTFGRRGIRAISDNNYALYLASAHGVETEVAILNELLNELQFAINITIYESDMSKESL